MRTRKCAALIEASLTCLVFAFLFMDWLFLALVIPLVMIAFAGVMLFHGRQLALDVSHRVSNTRVFEQDIVTVEVTITNNGSSISFLELYDTLPEKVSIIRGSNYAVTSLKAKETLTFSYDLSCPLRGHYVVGPLHVRVQGLLGLFYKEQFIPQESDVTVIPRMEDISDFTLGSRASPYPGLMHTKRAGLGTEFFGIRKYAPGDAFKRINWKSLARWGKPMVNEYELESTTDVILIVDARENQGHGSPYRNPLEYSIRAAVSLASVYLKRRDRVGLLVFGNPEGKLQWVYPEIGKKQLYKIIRELVEIQAEGAFTFQAAMHTAQTHMIPKKSLLILLSSLEEDPLLANAIQHLIARNYRVLVVSPSTAPLVIPDTATKTHQLTSKLLDFERENHISRLRQHGAHVIDWNPDQPLAVALKEVAVFQRRR